MIMDISSVDSQLFDWWLSEEASIERNDKNDDQLCHNRRIQMILFDTWMHIAQFGFLLCVFFLKFE